MLELVLLDVAIPPLTLGLLVVGGLIIIVLVTGLVALAEGVVLTLLKWGLFGECLKAALIMNLLTTLAGLLFMDLVPLGWTSIGISLIASILVEGLILNRFKPDIPAKNILVAFLANLASYILIIAPAYWMR